MSKEFLKLGDVEIEKRKSPSSKSPIDYSDINIDKITMSDEFPSTKKGF